MEKETEYEKLKRMGYTEEEIKIALDKIGKVNLTDGPMGPYRQDKTTVVTDRNGDSMKTSSIMMGYNGDHIVLPSGDYFSFEDFVEALQNALDKVTEKTIIACTFTGKIVESEEIVEGIQQMTDDAAKVLLAGPSDKITTQETRKVFVKGKGKEQDPIKKGLFMLGNGRVQLPSGEYIDAEDLTTALSRYVLMQKPIEPVIVPLPPSNVSGPFGYVKRPPVPRSERIESDIPKKPFNSTGETQEYNPVFDHFNGEPIPFNPSVEPIEDVQGSIEPTVEPIESIDSTTLPPTEIPTPPQNERKKVIKKSEVRCSLIPAITAGIVTAVMALQILPGRSVVSVEEMQHNDASYSVTRVVESEGKESIEDAIGRLTTGDKVTVDEGLEYHESSDHDYGGANTTGTFGKGIRQSGEYDLEYISVIHDGKIENVEFSEGVNLAGFIQKTAKEKGISEDQLEVMLHIGGPVSGWVSLNDLIEENRRDVKTIIETEDEYTGVQEDFEGTITIPTDNGEVVLNVVDEEGKLLDSSSIVTGSDGEMYRISSLKEYIQEERIYTETEEKGKVSFGIHNITKEEALLAGAIAIVGTMLSMRRKESIEEVTEEEYQKALEEYNDSHSTYVRIANMIDRGNPEWERVTVSYEGLDTVVKKISEPYDESSGKKV